MKLKRNFIFLVLLLIAVASAAGRVHTGVEELRSGGFAPLKGKRVGLVTNHTGVDADFVSTIDILHDAPGVSLTALFAPEHGVRGDVAAGAKVASAVDAATGVKIHSLYGSTKKPDAAMLKDVDVMVYDIQDIGCRSYTYISTLGNIMQACVENGLPLVVLDRPNPLGGERVEGPASVSPGCKSFVSAYSIPYIYGLTPGELARYLNATEFGGRCDLTVVEMKGWKRSMTFADTGLEWVPTSPNIPEAATALYYPATGILGELGVCQIGANFTLPFRLAVAGNIDADKLAADLTSYRLPGVKFRACHVKISGKQLHGVQVYVTDPKSARLVETQFYIMQALAGQGIDVLALAAPGRVDMFNKVCGSKEVARKFGQRHSVADILPLIRADVAAWRDITAPYLLY